jgi:hypothetical protein
MTKKSSTYSQLEAEAKSENTSGDRLWELARKDDNLALIVAQNTVAPEKLLQECGVTPSPDAPLNSENIGNENPPQASIPEPIETAQGKIQPAMGIKVTKDGRIILTAYRTNNAGGKDS